MHKLAPANTGGLQEWVEKACADAAAPPGQPVAVDRKGLQRECFLIDLRKRVVAVIGEAKPRDRAILQVDAPVRCVARLNDTAKGAQGSTWFRRMGGGSREHRSGVGNAARCLWL